MTLTINSVADTKLDESLGNQLDDLNLADLKPNVVTAFEELLGAGALNTAIEFAGPDVSDGIDAADYDITVTSGSVNSLSLTDIDGDPLVGEPTGIYTLNDNQIFLYSYDNIVLGLEGDGNLADPEGAPVFAIQLELYDDLSGDVEGGIFWMVLFAPLRHDQPANDVFHTLTDLVYVSGEEEFAFSFKGAPSGQNEFMAFGDTEVAIIASGDGPGNTVNSGQGGNNPFFPNDKTALGTNSQDIGAHERLIFTFVEGMDPNFLVPDLSSKEAKNSGNIDYDSLFGSTGAAFNVVKVTGGGASTSPDIVLAAYTTDMEEGAAFLPGVGDGDDVLVVIDSVTVNGLSEGDPDANFSVTYHLDGTVTITGVVENDRIAYTTVGDHNRLAIMNDETGNVAFSVSGFSLVSTSSDTTEAGSTLFFYDDDPSAAGSELIFTVHEDALPAGISEDASQTTIVTGENIANLFLPGQDALGGLITDIGFRTDVNGTTLVTANGLTIYLEVDKDYAGGNGTEDRLIGKLNDATGVVVFEAILDEDGTLSFELKTNIVHIDAGDLDFDSIGLGGTVEGFDADGDRALLANADDILARMEDDAPVADVTLSGTEPEAVYLFDGNTTGDGNFEGDKDFGLPDDDATADGPNFTTVNFAPAFGDNNLFGADGAGGVVTTHQLVLNVALGDPVMMSGAQATSGGVALVWAEVPGGFAAVPSGGGAAVFTLTADNAGVVTFTQTGVLDQPSADSGAPYTTDILTLDNGQVAIERNDVVSDSDNDTDTDSAQVDLGGNFGIGDDAPVAYVNTGGTEPEAVYLFDGNTTGDGNFEGDKGTALPNGDDPADQTPTSATVNFAPAFVDNNAFGADGAGSVNTTHGLVLTGADNKVYMTNGGGTAQATSGGVGLVWMPVLGGYAAMTDELVPTEIFRITTDAAGMVTFQQSGVLDHATASMMGPYSTDILTLADGQLALRRTDTVTDSDGDTDTAMAEVDLGGNFGIGDDAPVVEVGNIVGTGTLETQIGNWAAQYGADGMAALNGFQFAVEGYAIGATIGSIANVSVNDAGGGLYEVTITDDFDGDGDDEDFQYNVQFNNDGTYELTVLTEFGSSFMLSSADGALDAGGPDPVRTLSIGDENIVFTAVKALTTPGDRNSILGKTEDEIETLNPGFLSNKEMNVSTAGIGLGNNNMNGNPIPGIDGAVSQNKIDEAFIVDPESGFTSMKFFIDNSVGGYTVGTEELYVSYTLEGEDTWSAAVLVETLPGGLTPEAGGQVSFEVMAPAGETIDAVMVTMGKGTVKIPVIEFISETEVIADPVFLDMSVTVADNDGDSAVSHFSADLYADPDPQVEPDIVLVDAEVNDGVADDTADVFQIDVSDPEIDQWVIGPGFDSGVDSIAIVGGDLGTNFVINTSNGNDTVSINGGDFVVTIQNGAEEIQASDVFIFV